MKSQKLPPFGKLLADRQRFKNPPWLVVVCVGSDAWNSAKARNQRGDSVTLVLPPDADLAALSWPVACCSVVIEWTQPAPEQLVVELARELLRAGAESVTIWPRWVDYSNPNFEWPADQPPIKTYRVDRAQGSANAA
ncbi:hypothetical protein [Methylomonas methanica]|uniref:Uncharacterized protein n=1 Tax=Methylomonas methanica (strain DSM 25384 / MC09) TaxID=857087 RepID=G0A3U1_METMM|nr:hypothetical protein [Methylomonas methanica]AEG02713.1 hypothetical protein Metme_4365 [Methylomonas methanica MC09]